MAASARATVEDDDFGDGWEHDAVVEAIGDGGTAALVPVCVGRRRACPPEDCGGPWGYQNLLAALAHRNHPDHDELAESVPPDFDPEAFAVEEATEAMRSPRPLGAW